MSFILDALKKSEKERQREAVPGISDLPIVVHDARTSFWVLAVIAVLSLGVISLTWAWWLRSTPEPVASLPPTPATPGRAATATQPSPAAIEPKPAAPPRTRSLATEAARIAAASPPATPAQPLQPSAPAAARPTVTAAPMSIFEARAAGIAVPDLVLELLVYSDDPAQRFVFINASKYVEGDALAEGPRVLEISTEGAILSHNGRTFLLPQE